MSLSISSFKKTEWKVVAVVGLAVLALEAAARIAAPYLDYDRIHIHAFPEIVEVMEGEERPRVLALGNSLVMEGLDEGLLAERLSAQATAPCHVAKITPAGTAVRDWIYLYDNYLTSRDAHPDVVVVGFVGHHVADGSELRIRRLTRHFVSTNALWSCLRDEAPTFQDQALGALGHFSAVFGDQEALQWMTMHVFVPEYTEGVRKINHLLDDQEEERMRARAASDPSRKPPPTTYEDLARLIEVFQRHHVRATFVAMPQPHVWDLDSNLVKTVESGGATLLDARTIAGLTEDDFSDGYHLGASGAGKFTRFLAESLGNDLAP